MHMVPLLDGASLMGLHMIIIPYNHRDGIWQSAKQQTGFLTLATCNPCPVLEQHCGMSTETEWVCN